MSARLHFMNEWVVPMFLYIVVLIFFFYICSDFWGMCPMIMKRIAKV